MKMVLVKSVITAPPNTSVGPCMRVNLKAWMGKNGAYVATWILMGLIALGLVIRELGIYTLAIIIPFLPPFIIAMVRMAQELRK
jgi:hypothetical protein